MGVEVWSEALYLHTEQFKALHESLLHLYRKQIEVASSSPAEVIWFGDNVTGTVVSPAIYQEYCVPVYNEVCETVRQKGKLSFAHYDGENLVLKDLISGVKLDIIEAFTPPPMERMTVKEAREAWPDKVLSLNFPGNLFTEDDSIIREYTSSYIKEAGDSSGFIIGCTEEFDFTTFGKSFDAIADTINGHFSC
jgi:uroporphyrinogen-III decarboxylase